jgi:hypothetical protein
MQIGGVTSRMSARNILIALVLGIMLSGSAGGSWRRARNEDTIAAYHRFLREYPQSRYSDRARARLDLARVKKHPTPAGIDAFRAKYSDPELLEELKPHVEAVLFQQARAAGSAESYRQFLDEYPTGALARRAQGNLAYLENGGFGVDTKALAGFAGEHPMSDYAAEAVRSVSALRVRSATGFDRVGLVIEVVDRTPGGERLRQVFRERAVAAFAAAGIATQDLPSAGSAREANIPALLTIRHEENEAAPQLEQGRFTEPAVVARTDVSLRRVDGTAPIWSDTFEYRAPLAARRDEVSILFSPGSISNYWADFDGKFFVPIARWATDAAARRPHLFAKPVVALDMAGSRAAVLFGDGDFQVLDVGEPEQLQPVAEYRRDRDLSRFSGISIDGSRVMIYGTDGVEVVRLDGDQAQREFDLSRDQVGSVVEVEPRPNGWLAATSRGLLEIDSQTKSVRTLVARPILGLARGSAERLVFTDGVSVYVASETTLGSGRVDAELRLGRGFKPQRIRAHNGRAVVLGARDTVWVDLQSPTPRLLARIGGKETGRVLDAATIQNQLFLIGPRGLQVADPSGERIVDSVDVIARERVAVEGRHLVMIGDRSLQVVDATAFVATPPASQD